MEAGLKLESLSTVERLLTDYGLPLSTPGNSCQKKISMASRALINPVFAQFETVLRILDDFPRAEKQSYRGQANLIAIS